MYDVYDLHLKFISAMVASFAPNALLFDALKAHPPLKYGCPMLFST